MSTMHCMHGGCAPGGNRGCMKGHDVRELVGGPNWGWMVRTPCVITAMSHDIAPCPDQELETHEEHFRDILAYMDSLTEGELRKASLCDGRSIGPESSDGY